MAQYSFWNVTPAKPIGSNRHESVKQPDSTFGFSPDLAFSKKPMSGWYIDNARSSSDDSTSAGLSEKPSHMSCASLTAASVADSTQQDFLMRYSQLKELEKFKNELVEELLEQRQILAEQLAQVTADYDREREYNRTIQGREKTFQENVRRVQTHLDRDPYVLVLLDGNSMLFQEQLYKKGSVGGSMAAALLQAAVAKHVSSVFPELLVDCPIFVRLYADLQLLVKSCFHTGIVDSPTMIEQFVRGFSQANIHVDFIDVGSECHVSNKLSANLYLHLYDYRCRQIILGSSYDDGFARLLDSVVADEQITSRLTILEGSPMEQGYKVAGLKKINLSNVFQELNCDLEPLPSPESSVFSSLATPLSRQLSQVNIKDVKDFTPGLFAGRTMSVSTESSSKPSPKGWASVAARPAPIVPPPATTPATPPTPSPSQVPRNRKGQRVDPVIKHDKVEVDRVKKLKMCNVHYLRKDCPYGDACSHDHFYKPSTQELQTLRLVARMAPCMHGSDCEEVKCIYGHICPAPEGRDGKDCIFGDQCRFPHELHKIDRVIVKTVRV